MFHEQKTKKTSMRSTNFILFQRENKMAAPSLQDQHQAGLLRSNLGRTTVFHLKL
jgi:hypothetical protein